jgi:hypothetical protein
VGEHFEKRMYEAPDQLHLGRTGPIGRARRQWNLLNPRRGIMMRLTKTLALWCRRRNLKQLGRRAVSTRGDPPFVRCGGGRRPADSALRGRLRRNDGKALAGPARYRAFRRQASKEWSSSRGSACSCRPTRRPRSSPASIPFRAMQISTGCRSGPVGEHRANLNGPVGGAGVGVGRSFRSLPCRGRRRAVSAARLKPDRTPEKYP